MELLSPAGNIEKLRYAYLYGADAAYIGLSGFSLRAQADNFTLDSAEAVRAIKGDKRLYGVFNIYFKDANIKTLESQIDKIAHFPFDAIVLSDIGILPLIKNHFPQADLHLSTQANCLNSQAAAFYRDLGFSRIIPGRELSLKELEAIKHSVPELELEVFVHGAMCLAYSGRCFLSSWMTGRSANQGDCSHSCRWKFDVHHLAESGELSIREEQRPHEYYPIYEGEGFTSILSSKDICMIDHLAELRDIGIDSIKIEGRIKSVYYLAMVTRAYRRELDRLAQNSTEDTQVWKDELYKVSHREFSTGFYFDHEAIEQPTDRSYEASHLFVGTIEGELQLDGEFASLLGLTPLCRDTNGRQWRRFKLDLKNSLAAEDAIESVGPQILGFALNEFHLVNQTGRLTKKAVPGRYQEIYSPLPLENGHILRKKLP